MTNQEPQLSNNPYYWFRCRIIKRPRCYRKLDNGTDFAMCKWCGHQSEIHR